MIALQGQPLAISLDASDFHSYHSGVLDFDDCGADLNHAVRTPYEGEGVEEGLGFGDEEGLGFGDVCVRSDRLIL